MSEAGRWVAHASRAAATVLGMTEVTATANTADPALIAEELLRDVMSLMDDIAERQPAATDDEIRTETLALLGQHLINALVLDLTEAQGGHLRLVTD